MNRIFIYSTGCAILFLTPIVSSPLGGDSNGTFPSSKQKTEPRLGTQITPSFKKAPKKKQSKKKQLHKEQIVQAPTKCRWKIERRSESPGYVVTFTWNKSKTPDVSEYRIFHWSSRANPFVIPASHAKKYTFSFEYPYSFIREDDYRVVAVKNNMCSFEGFFEGPEIDLRNPEHFKNYDPPNLSQLFPDVPLADKSGLVLKSEQIKIDSNPNAYNPSIIRNGNGYFIVFRDHAHKENSIYSIVLNDRFQPIEQPHPINTGANLCEDPRLFFFRNQLYMMYTPTSSMPIYSTSVAIGKLDMLSSELSNNFRLLYQKRFVEKNWVFFENDSSLYCIYSFNPYKILKVNEAFDGGMTEVVSEEETKFDWEAKWGRISGGTPAILVDGEYLSFFHSFFLRDGVRVYALGAYTFESTFPFQRKKISEYPILWEKMYSTPKTPHTPICNLLWSVVFPGGFVKNVENGRQVINLAYGENDSGICVLTLDKESLLKSLIPLNE